MCARKRPQSGCKRLTKSSGTNAQDVKGKTGEWDWTSRSGLEDVFFPFSLLHTYTIAYEKSDVRWAISSVSVTSTPLPIVIYMIRDRLWVNGFTAAVPLTDLEGSERRPDRSQSYRPVLRHIGTGPRLTKIVWSGRPVISQLGRSYRSSSTVRPRAGSSLA